MAFTNYSELQADIASWMHRTDLGTNIPGFIALAESRVSRKLYLLDWEARVTLLTVDSAIPLPSDYKTLRSVLFGDFPLEYRTPAQFAEETQPQEDPANPAVYTILGNSLVVGDSVADGAEVTLDYIARMVPLSVSEPVNWVLTNHPDLLFYGSMEAACSYIKDTQSEVKWAAKYSAVMKEVKIENENSRYAGVPLVIRSA